MSQDDVEVVRQPFALKGRSRRGLDERIYMLVPQVLALAFRAAFRLPSRSRLRQAVLRQIAQTGFDATNRGDFASGFLLHHAHVEFITGREFAALGFDPVYRGRKARFEFQRRWSDEWGEVRSNPPNCSTSVTACCFLGA